MVLNLCYDKLRTREGYTDKGYSDEVSPELIDSALIPEQCLDQSQQGDLISATLAALPNRQREVLVLQYYQVRRSLWCND